MEATHRIYTQRPNNFKIAAHASCCFIFWNSRLLFLRKTRLWQGKWCCPGGKLEEGESASGAVMREVLEETGLSLHEKDVTPKGTLYVCSPWGSYQLDSFETVFAEKPAVCLNDEHDALLWAPTDSALQVETIPSQREVLSHHYPGFSF